MKKIFIAEKNDIAKAMIPAIFKKVTKQNNVLVEGELIDGNKGVICICAGHIIQGPEAWEYIGITKNEYYTKLKENPEVFKFEENFNYLNYTKPSQVKMGYVTGQERLEKFNPHLSNLGNNDVLISATDPDDEGALIFLETADYFKIDVTQNNVFTMDLGSTSKEAIKKQYNGTLSLFSTRIPEANRAIARKLYDATYGWNASNAFERFNIGRLKGAILKLVGDNQHAKINFTEEYTYGIIGKINENEFTSNYKFKSKDEAKELLLVLKNNVKEVKVETTESIKTISHPKLHNEISLTKALSGKLEGDLSKIGNELRLKHSLISYMRTKDKVVKPETAVEINKNAKMFLEHPRFTSLKVTDEISSKSISTKKIDHDAIHFTSTQFKKADELPEDYKKVYYEVVERTLANMSEKCEYKEFCNKIIVDMDHEALGNMTYKEALIIDEGYLKIYPSGDKPANVKDIITKFNDNNKIDFELVEFISKPKPPYTQVRLEEKLDQLANDIEEPELKAIYKQVNGIGTTSTVKNTIKQMVKEGQLTTKGKHKIINATKEGMEMYYYLERTNNPLTNLLKSAQMELKLEDIKYQKNTLPLFINEVNDEVQEMMDIIHNNPIPKLEKKLGNCPTCGNEVVAKKGKFGKFYACSDKECKFTLPGYANLTDSDVEKLLSGKKTNQKKQKSKAGKEYKCKYYLKGDKLEMEFVNKK